MDLPDVKLVVQWCAPTSISTLWQRFGRCVRDPSLQGTAILLGEKEYFDHMKNAKNKRKRGITIKTEPGTTAKRPKVASLSNHTNNTCSVDNELMDVDGIDGKQAEADDEQEEDGEDGEEDDERDDDERDIDEEREKQTDRRKCPKGPRKFKKTAKKDKIEPAIFDLLNAECRGIGCRRRPFMDNFQNSKAGKRILYHVGMVYS